MIFIKYKHNDSNKTIESLSYNLSLLFLCNVEWPASIERKSFMLFMPTHCSAVVHEAFV